ncbi:hypothetical protein ElyMa_004748300 [Elysia marginata]|uniref:Uncharacterized protein n=1 Tax=Elysia marginata TaxID=1093978 RepID=A0AAV4ICZ6_9GAST|nr:hypothetical protein ElyMa_004748300 [Elysia marginata]
MPQHLTTRTKQLGVRKLANKDIDYTQYSVKSTFKRIPHSRIVLCPWRVFSADPESVSDSFRELAAEDLISYADDINVMLNVEGMKTPEFGIIVFIVVAVEVVVVVVVVEVVVVVVVVVVGGGGGGGVLVCGGGRGGELAEQLIIPPVFQVELLIWIIRTDEINLDNIIDQIKSNPILLGVTLTNRKLLGDHEEIPVVAFLDHKTPEVREAVMKLETCRDELHNKPDTKFCVEVDIGETVSRWASEVLGQSMTSVGGRFVVTNGDTVNHMFDWSNICAFLPIICCCVFAIPIYKLKRKATYNDFTYVVEGDSVILGAATDKTPDQRLALLTLMRRARTDPKFSRESPDSGVHLPPAEPSRVRAPAPPAPVPAPLAPEAFSKKNDRTTVLQVNKKSKLKPARKPSVNLIQVDYAKDKDKKEEEEPKPEPKPEGIQRQDSYMQAEDLDTIARAFKMSKTAAEPRPSVVSPVTLSNFRADLLFGDVESDEEMERSRRGSVASNFLDPNYEEEMGKFFKSTPNPLTNIELMQFLTTKNKPAAQKTEDELRKIELAKKKRSKVGKGWATAQTKFNEGKMNGQKE